ncbi:MAG: hypothetical protein HW387_137 [Parachlamydiales bacterium]|nr:hypothetical protein [Parachlamydiales bacterium]
MNPIRPIDFHIPSSIPPEMQKPTSEELQDLVANLRKELFKELEVINVQVYNILIDLAGNVKKHMADPAEIFEDVADAERQIITEISNIRTNLTPDQEATLRTQIGDQFEDAWGVFENQLLLESDPGDYAESTLQYLKSIASQSTLGVGMEAVTSRAVTSGTGMTLQQFAAYLIGNKIPWTQGGSEYMNLILAAINTLPGNATMADLSQMMRDYVGDPNGDGSKGFPPLFTENGTFLTLNSTDISNLTSQGFIFPTGLQPTQMSSPPISSANIPINIHPPADWDFSKGNYHVEVTILGRLGSDQADISYFNQDGTIRTDASHQLIITFTSATDVQTLELPPLLFSNQVQLQPELADGTYRINSPITIEGTNDANGVTTEDITGVNSAQEANALMAFQYNYASPTTGMVMSRAITLPALYSGSTQNMTDIINEMKNEMQNLAGGDGSVWENIFYDQTGVDGATHASPVSPKNCAALADYYNSYLTNTYLSETDSNSIKGLTFSAPNLDYSKYNPGNVTYTCVDPAYQYHGNTYIEFQGSDKSIILLDQNLYNSTDGGRAWWDGGYEGRWSASSVPLKDTDGIQIYTNCTGNDPTTGTQVSFGTQSPSIGYATIPALIKEIVAPLNMGIQMSIFKGSSPSVLVPPGGIDGTFLKDLDSKYRYQSPKYNLYMRVGLDCGLNTYLFDFQDVLGLDNTRSCPSKQLVSIDIDLSNVNSSTNLPTWANHLIRDLQAPPPFTGEELAFANDLIAWVKNNVGSTDDFSKVVNHLESLFSNPATNASNDLYYKYPGLRYADAEAIYGIVSNDASSISTPTPTPVDSELIALMNIYPVPGNGTDAAKLLSVIEGHIIGTDPTIALTDPSNGLNNWVQKLFSDPEFFTQAYPALLSDPAQKVSAEQMAAIFQVNAMFKEVLTEWESSGSPGAKAFANQVLLLIGTTGWQTFGDIQTAVQNLGNSIFYHFAVPSLTQNDVDEIYGVLQLGASPQAPFGIDYRTKILQGSLPWTSASEALRSDLLDAINGVSVSYPIKGSDFAALQNWFASYAATILGPGVTLGATDVKSFETLVDGESIVLPSSICPAPLPPWEQFQADMLTWVQKGPTPPTPEFAFINPIWGDIDKNAPWDNLADAQAYIQGLGQSIYTLNQTPPNQLTQADVDLIYADLSLINPPSPPTPGTWIKTLEAQVMEYQQMANMDTYVENYLSKHGLKTPALISVFRDRMQEDGWQYKPLADLLQISPVDPAYQSLYMQHLQKLISLAMSPGGFGSIVSQTNSFNAFLNSAYAELQALVAGGTEEEWNTWLGSHQMSLSLQDYQNWFNTLQQS